MRCKIGDRAFVIKGFQNNIGKVVRIHERSDFFPGYWYVGSEGLPLEGVHLMTGIGGFNMSAHIDDSELLPIRGEPDDTEVTEREKELTE
jgi:hypothetical protein